MIDPNEKPYYILDYNRQYKEDGTLPTGKVEFNIITNIKINTPSRQRLKEETRKYEKKFSPRKRFGKYIALVSLPNGRSAYVNLVPSAMTEQEVTGLFTELQNRSIKTTEENVENKEVKSVGYNRAYNKDLQSKVFIGATPGVYLEMKLSQDGSFRIDYSDLTIKKGAPLQKGTFIIKAKAFQELSDIQEVLDSLNEKMFGSKSPIEGKAFITLENFRNSVPKNPTITDIQNMSTQLNKEVKKDINFSLSSNENIHVIKRRVAKSAPQETIKDAESMTPEEKMESYRSDHKNVDPKILENIAKKQNADKQLTDLELAIAAENMDLLAGLRLKFATKPVSQSNTVSEATNQSAVSEIRDLTEKIKTRKRQIRTENRENPENVNKSNRDINNIAAGLIAADPEIKLLEAKLRLAQSKANKIIKGFDGHDIEDIETFTRWVQDNLPAEIRN